MNLKKITKRDEFWEFAEVWYQRSHRLRHIWQCDTETKSRRDKAHRLWVIMLERMRKILQIAIILNQHKHPDDD